MQDQGDGKSSSKKWVAGVHHVQQMIKMTRVPTWLVFCICNKEVITSDYEETPPAKSQGNTNQLVQEKTKETGGCTMHYEGTK